MTAVNDPVRIDHPAVAARPDLSDGAPEGLRRMLEGGRSLLLVGRNSSSSGRAGALAAARDLHDAAQELRDAFGFDVTTCLPSETKLADALMATKARRSIEPGGHAFTNRYAVFALPAQGLVLSVSAGSAMKLDADGRQPHAEHLRVLLSNPELRLGGFYAKRPDRGTRDTWAVKVYLRPLEHLKSNGQPVWAARERNEYALNGNDDINVFVEGYAANTDATTIKKKRLTGARRWTATQPDKNGWISWGVGRAVPPGMARLKVKNGRSILIFDSPGLYPDQNLLTSVLPAVRLDDGTLANQVANVRWFWENLPHLGLQETMRDLCRRRYSTQSLRDRAGRGPGSYYGSEEDPFNDPTQGWDSASSWSRSLLNHLEFYKTGDLEIELKPGEPPVTITGVIPPDGPWITPAVADEVDAYLQRPGRTRTKPANSWSWSRFPITINGTPGELRPPYDVDDPEVRWRVYPLDQAAREGHFPAIPDHQLMGAITDALIAAEGQPLRAAFTDTDSPETRTLLQRRDALESDIRTRVRNLETRQAAIQATDPDSGAFLMPTAFRTSEMGRWETDHHDLEGLRADALALQRQIADLRIEDGVDVKVLERILADLREPRTSPMRSHLREAVSNLAVTYRRVSEAGFRGYQVDLNGELLLSHLDEAYALPFHSTFQTGAITRQPSAVAEMATAMRYGQVPTHTGRRVPGTLTLLAKTLGATDRTFALGRCQDPDLLRLGMAAIYPQPVPGEDPETTPTLDDLLVDPQLVNTFGDVHRLVANVRAALGRGDSRWIIKDGAPFETWAILAGTGVLLPLDFGTTQEQGIANLRHQATRKDRALRYARWQFQSGRLPSVAPCQHCGSALCTPMRIREVEGFLCLKCRQDEGGVTWPRHFDRYLPNRSLWESAGVVEPLPTPRDPSIITIGPRYRPLVDLSADEIDKIADAYCDRTQPIRDIAQRHGISHSTIYAIRSERALPRRYPGSGR